MPAVYYDAVGDLQLAELGPYSTLASALADLVARKAEGRPYPNPNTTVDRNGQWFVVNTKYGPSISHFQIRALHNPNAWGQTDKIRVAAKLRDPAYASYAAWLISKGGTDFTPWSAYKSGDYAPHVGRDYALISGHPRAGSWNK